MIFLHEKMLHLLTNISGNLEMFEFHILKCIKYALWERIVLSKSNKSVILFVFKAILMACLAKLHPR